MHFAGLGVCLTRLAAVIAAIRIALVCVIAARGEPQGHLEHSPEAEMVMAM